MASQQSETAIASASLPSAFAPMLLAAGALHLAIAFNNGAYAEPAIVFVLLGLMVLAWRYLANVGKAGGSLTAGFVLPGLWVVVVCSVFWSWNDKGLLLYPVRPWEAGRSAQLYMLVLLLTYVPSLAGWKEPGWLSWARIAVFGALVVVAGVDTILASPRPWIDVWEVQQQGAEALLKGHNPYTSVAVHDTAPGVVRNNVPYVYVPAQVCMSLIGYVAAHDVRYTMLLAVIVSGVCMRTVAGCSPVALPPFAKDAPTLFLWLAPKLFFIIEQAWNDPVPLMWICLGVTAFAWKKRLLAAVLFGVATASKQPNMFLFPMVGFALGFTLREWIAMAAAGAATIAPFAVWDFHALKFSTFDFVTALPSRPDALTLITWANRKFTLELQGGVAFPMTFAFVAFTAWRMRGIAALAAGVAFTYTAFFAFNKWAYANYYFYVSGLAALAGASALARMPITRQSAEVG